MACEGLFTTQLFTTHHYACDCREEYIKKVEAKLAIAIQALKYLIEGHENEARWIAAETLKKIMSEKLSAKKYREELENG